MGVCPEGLLPEGVCPEGLMSGVVQSIYANKSPNLDKIATEKGFTVNKPQTHVEQHITNVDDKIWGEVA